MSLGVRSQGGGWGAAQATPGMLGIVLRHQPHLFQISLASRMPKDQGLCHVLEQVYSVLKQGI